MPEDTRAQMLAPERPEAAADRAAAILALARRAFVEKGFDGASMKDLARAAGMSAGNFYRYFPSKAALVEAMIARDLAVAERDFRAVTGARDPLAALKVAIAGRLERSCDDDSPLWAEIIAAAGRKPDIAALLWRMEEGIKDRIAQVLALVSGLSPAEARARFGAVIRIIFILVRGAAIDRIPGMPADREVNALIVETIERLLDDVVATVGKG
ncbi:MAG: TetR/AcrR family transcriptional regulator [Rhodobacteraceae bacterium]|nr:TetR/AcrR family transcriptional regulator [Paracoccaceae bacterium]